MVSGGDLWTGYLTLMATAALGVLLFFTDQMQARLFRVLSNVAGVTWFIAMLLLFIHCKPLDT